MTRDRVASAQSSQATDPVCGMTVEPANAAGSATHRQRTYYFCSTHCLKKFQADPEKFVGEASEAAASHPTPPAGEYTCPMHPEVVSDRPGTCPKCSMALWIVYVHWVRPGLGRCRPAAGSGPRPRASPARPEGYDQNDKTSKVFVTPAHPPPLWSFCRFCRFCRSEGDGLWRIEIAGNPYFHRLVAVWRMKRGMGGPGGICGAFNHPSHRSTRRVRANHQSQREQGGVTKSLVFCRQCRVQGRVHGRSTASQGVMGTI